MQGKLIITNGNDKGVEYPFSQDSKITIGRGKNCSIVLNDNKVSTVHCQIDILGDNCSLTDLGSTNGCYVNEEKIQVSMLKNGDSIHVGRTDIKVEYQVGEVKKNTVPKGPPEITEAWSEGDLPTAHAEEAECIGDYKILKPIEGLGGEYFQAEQKIHNNIVMLKRLTVPQMPNNIQNFSQNEDLYKKLEHPRILKIFGIINSQDIPVVVMEYCQGSLLLDWVKKKGKVSTTRALKIAAYIASALDYLHSQEIYDVGVSPHSIIVEDGTKRIKLFDIALTRFLQESGYPVSSLKERDAPFCGEQNGKLADLYSLGTMLFYLLSQKFPKEVAKKKKQPISWLKEKRKLPTPLVSLLEKTLIDSPTITARQFYKETSGIFKELKEKK